MDRVDRRPIGYVLGKGRGVSDVIAAEEKLLRSEGINPEWPGFTPEEERKASRQRRHRG